MHRQFLANLIAKTPRSASDITHYSISSGSFASSSFWKTNANPRSKHFSSQYWTLPSSRSWKFCGSTEVSTRIRDRFSWRPALARRFFSKIILKGRSDAPVRGIVGGQARRAFYSFGSQNRGWRSISRRLTSDGVVIGLIVANAAVFILWRVSSPQFMVSNFMISVDNFTSGRLHTLITSAFSHRDMWHLISNMVGLYFFGMSIGRSFGPEYLLKLYISGALVGSIFYLVYHAFIAQSLQSGHMRIDPSKIPGLGASGAVNAIMLLDIFLFPTKTLYFDFIIPVPAILLGIFIIGKDILRILELLELNTSNDAMHIGSQWKRPLCIITRIRPRTYESPDPTKLRIYWGDRQVSGSAHLGGATVAALAWTRARRGRFGRF